MATESLKLGNNEWAVKEGSLLAYNDNDNVFGQLPFTVERDSTATYVDRNGLIQTAEKNVPRIDFSDDPNGVLLTEPESTNLITHSEDFSDASWSTSTAGAGSVPVITSNYTVAPDGNNTADRIVFDAGVVSGSDFSTIVYNISGRANPHDSSISIWVKSNTSENYLLMMYNRANQPINFTATSQWQRITLSANVSNTSDKLQFGLLELSGVTTDNYADISVWGAQLEELPYATSYIPTNGSTVTRLQDEVTGAGNSTTFNSEEGVLYAEISALADIDWGYSTISLISTNYNRIILGFSNDIDKFIYYVIGGGVSSTNIVKIDASDNNTSLNTFNKLAISWSVSSIKFYLNGSEVGSYSGTLIVPTQLDGLNLNGTSQFTEPFFGKTKDLRVYNTALTDQELIDLTT